MIEEFLDKIINTYVKEINKIHPLREEIPLFTAFVLSNVKQDDPKYFYLKKILLNLIFEFLITKFGKLLSSTISIFLSITSLILLKAVAP